MTQRRDKRDTRELVRRNCYKSKILFNYFFVTNLYVGRYVDRHEHTCCEITRCRELTDCAEDALVPNIFVANIRRLVLETLA